MSDKNKPLLRIGRIPYANLFPIFYCLEKGANHSLYRFTSGVPSTLNKLLRSGRLDVSVSSSIEYLRHKNIYSIIPWFSVSSAGPVGSIFLFSKLPIHALDKKTIAVSSHSETSVVLLKIMLRNFFSLTCSFKAIHNGSIKEILASFPACLLIGDAAMKVKKQSMAAKAGSGSPLYVYDLGELWFQYTGLPFVFALWIVRKKTISQKKELIEKLSQDLMKAKKCIYHKFPLIARRAPQRTWLSTGELVDYWKGISYDFTDRHLEGLKLFEKYAFKMRR